MHHSSLKAADQVPRTAVYMSMFRFALWFVIEVPRRDNYGRRSIIREHSTTNKACNEYYVSLMQGNSRHYSVPYKSHV